MTKKERALIALKAHEQGLNCAQCMLLSFADVTGLSEPQSCGIATGFGGVSNPVPGAAAPAKEDKPSVVPAGVGPVVPPVPLDENGKDEPESDPFDDIFKIFNKK